MTNLTEQWKKGELPEGDYYYKLDGIIDIGTKDGLNVFEFYADETRKKDMEVLGRVPSYEEWDKLNNACHELEKETACLTVDIVKLKELLKECKHIMSIEKDFASCHFEKDKLCKLLAKINKALGEE